MKEPFVSVLAGRLQEQLVSPNHRRRIARTGYGFFPQHGLLGKAPDRDVHICGRAQAVRSAKTRPVWARVARPSGDGCRAVRIKTRANGRPESSHDLGNLVEPEAGLDGRQAGSRRLSSQSKRFCDGSQFTLFEDRVVQVWAPRRTAPRLAAMRHCGRGKTGSNRHWHARNSRERASRWPASGGSRGGLRVAVNRNTGKSRACLEEDWLPASRMLCVAKRGLQSQSGVRSALR